MSQRVVLGVVVVLVLLGGCDASFDALPVTSSPLSPIYQRKIDTTAPLPHPSTIPGESSADLGTGPVIRHSADALTRGLPR